MTNSSIATLATATVGATILAFPVRANAGGWDKLLSLGAKLVADQGEDGAVLNADGSLNVAASPFRTAKCEVPDGWVIRDSGVSLWQKRLFDGNGKMLAKIFYKPTGGCGSVHVMLSDDDPMAAPDVLPVFTQERVEPKPLVCDGVSTFNLAKRINEGGRGRLTELGVTFTGNGDFQYNEVVIPAGWQFRATDNPLVSHLHNAAGELVARLYFRPTGGTPSVHVLTADEANAAH